MPEGVTWDITSVASVRHDPPRPHKQCVDRRTDPPAGRTAGCRGSRISLPR